ncbi:MAG TPA: c-type cytochrome domain-containing protein, partial [Planctomycetia bacterium]|nr:c-type cytochrome domain-containing protein [Planctomycetia bacterium]
MILGLVLSFSAASALAPDGDAPTFAADVYPVLVEKCLSCHDTEGGLAEAGLDLTTVAGIEKGGKRGPAAKKGKSGESLLYLLASKTKMPAMPPEIAGVPLTSGELALVRKWIDRGMPAGASPPAAMKKAVKVVPGPPPPGVRPVLAIDLDKTGALLAFGSGDAVFVYELPSGKRLAKLPGPPETTHSLRISADGTCLAAGGFQSV